MRQNSAGQKPQTKITPWRVLNSLLVLGLGTYKATVDQMCVQSTGAPVRPVVLRLPMVGPCWPMGGIGGIWSCISAAAIFRFGRDSSGL
jgi:hypothetical protein